MICDVCGHANADRLTFCQECGRRLKSRDARVVAPTPPQGMPKVVLPPAAPSPSPSAPASPAPALPLVPPTPPVPQAPPSGARPSARSRPESAPPPAPVALAPAGKTRDPSEPASPVASAAAASASAVTCPTCGTSNPAMYRFCVACGVTLPRDAARAPSPAAAPVLAAVPSPAAAPAPAPADRTPVERAPSPTPVERAPSPTPAERAAPVSPAPAPSSPAVAPAPAPAAQHGTSAPAAQAAPDAQGAAASPAPQAARQEERIIGAPVVEIAPGGAPQKPIVCPRCGGQCIPAARFCQFCGAPLGGDGRNPSLAARLELDDARGQLARDLGAPANAHASHARAHAPAGRGRLVVIEADGSEGMTFALADRPLDIGRSEGDILVKEDPYVSPRHARLVPDGARWLLRDLASTNGVYLRVKKPHLLQDADLLLLGQEVLQFQLVSEPEKGLGHASQHGTLLFGSPITSRSARLCQRTVEGITRDVYYLHRDETVIGRETGDIVFTADPFLSRRHAMIRRTLARKENAGRAASRWDFTLTDLDSSNGTFVAIRGEVVLAHGDFVRVGQHLFRVDFA